MTAAARFLLALLLLLAAASCAPRTPTPIPPTETPPPVELEDGIIVRIKGDVRLRKAGQDAFAPAHEGHMVSSDDEIQTEEESEATILCTNGQAQVIGASKLEPVKCPKQPPEVTPDPWDEYAYSSIRSWYQGELSPLPPVTLFDEGLDEIPIIVSPAGTALVKPNPRFRWMKVTGADKYRVTVSDEQQSIWETETSHTWVDYPSDQPELELQPDVTYRLEVQAVPETAPLAQTEFVVLDPTKVAQLVPLEKRFDETSDAVIRALTLASLHRSFGLQGEAIYELERLPPDKPASVYGLLGQWYLEAGFPRIAEEHYLDAHELYTERRDERGVASTLLGLGLSFCAYGKVEEGTKSLWISANKFQALGDPASATRAIDFITTKCAPAP